MVEGRLYLRDLAREVDRATVTVRKWKLPPDLSPMRDKRGWRYWSIDQLPYIKIWMEKNEKFPGSGLRNFNPSAVKMNEMLIELRKPRIYGIEE